MKKTDEVTKDNGSADTSESVGNPNEMNKASHPSTGISIQRSNRVLASDFQSVLRANAGFYSAFDSLDFSAMEDVWLTGSKECFCKFPGSRKLIGTAKIMKSWKLAVEKMSGSLRRNWLEPREIQVEFRSPDSAVIFCEELIYAVTSSVVNGQLRPRSSLIQKYLATNGFKKVKGKWYMWFHEASIPNNARILERSEQESPAEQSWSELTSMSIEDEAFTVTTADVNKKAWSCGSPTAKCSYS